MSENHFPEGWDEERVRRLIQHYEEQTEDGALAEDEAAEDLSVHGSFCYDADGGAAMVAILSPDLLPEIRMTVDEYLHADLPEGYRYELVRGVVQTEPWPEMPHDRVLQKLHRRFVLDGERRPDSVERISQRAGIILADRQTAREPDFAVYGPPVDGDWRNKTWKDVTPILVAEVFSPDQDARDHDDKRGDYWDAGVGAYWILDMARRILIVLNRGATEWVEARYDRSQTYRPLQFPGLEIPVGQLLGS